MNKYIVILPFLMFSLLAYGQNEHESLQNGDKYYKGGRFDKAEEEYLRATEENPNSVKGHFNRGNSIYSGIDTNEDPEKMNQRLDKAAEMYQLAIEKAQDKETRSKAYHNLGNVMMEKQEFAKGLEAYKNALRNNPNDLETKNNLMQALRQMRIQQQQQQQQQSGEKGQNDENQEQQEQQQQEQEQQENQENQDQQQEQNQQDQEQKEDQEKEEGSQGQSGEEKEEMTPEDVTEDEVMRQLKVMDEEEKKVQEKLKKEQQSQYKSDKDW